MSEDGVSILEGSPAVNPNDFRHEKPHGEFGKTIEAVRRVKSIGFFEEPDKDAPNGYFQDRPIIGRDTTINGGVYIGAGSREAVVVDDSKQPELANVYQTTLKNISRNGMVDKSQVLQEVFDQATKTIRYDGPKTDQIARQYPDKKVALGVYISQGFGVCRHQALLVAYLLEKLKKDGYVQGKVSVDRNYVRGKGGHAWARYTNSLGEVYIIDPAQQYLGKLSKVPEDRWFYERPEDLKPEPELKSRWQWPWKR